ncbi:MAG: hypothetical protein ACI8RD_007269 [Bacillariaceae sp.]|jgi:hypothetical protein
MELDKPPAAFTIGIQGRGRVLKEALAQHEKKHRRRLMDIYIRFIPDEMDFIDGVVLIAMLSMIL